MHILFTLLIKKTPKNGYTRKSTYTVFYETLKSKFKKKFFFRNPKVLKFGMPKK